MISDFFSGSLKVKCFMMTLVYLGGYLGVTTVVLFYHHLPLISTIILWIGMGEGGEPAFSFDTIFTRYFTCFCPSSIISLSIKCQPTRLSCKTSCCNVCTTVLTADHFNGADCRCETQKLSSCPWDIILVETLSDPNHVHIKPYP